MPLFDFKCPNCNEVKADVLLKLAEHDKIINCNICKAPMKKLLSTPNFKIGRSFFVKPPSAAEQKSSEWIMQDYKNREAGSIG